MEFPESERRRVVELCRRHGLFMAAASDNHGFGSAACAWNLLRIPGWRELDADGLEAQVLRTLSQGGFGAVTVAARRSLPPSQGDLIWLDPPRALWLMLRTFTWPQALAALLWAWMPLALCGLRRRQSRS